MPQLRPFYKMLTTVKLFKETDYSVEIHVNHGFQGMSEIQEWGWETNSCPNHEDRI